MLSDEHVAAQRAPALRCSSKSDVTGKSAQTQAPNTLGGVDQGEALWQSPSGLRDIQARVEASNAPTTGVETTLCEADDRRSPRTKRQRQQDQGGTKSFAPATAFKRPSTFHEGDEIVEGRKPKWRRLQSKTTVSEAMQAELTRKGRIVSSQQNLTDPGVGSKRPKMKDVFTSASVLGTSKIGGADRGDACGNSPLRPRGSHERLLDEDVQRGEMEAEAEVRSDRGDAYGSSPVGSSAGVTGGADRGDACGDSPLRPRSSHERVLDEDALRRKVVAAAGVETLGNIAHDLHPAEADQKMRLISSTETFVASPLDIFTPSTPQRLECYPPCFDRFASPSAFEGGHAPPTAWAAHNAASAKIKYFL